jgi:hypothetical protein
MAGYRSLGRRVNAQGAERVFARLSARSCTHFIFYLYCEDLHNLLCAYRPPQRPLLPEKSGIIREFDTMAQAPVPPPPSPPAAQSSSVTYNGTAEGSDHPAPGPDAVPYPPPTQGHAPAANEGIGDKFKDAGSWIKDYGTALKHGS